MTETEQKSTEGPVPCGSYDPQAAREIITGILLFWLVILMILIWGDLAYRLKLYLVDYGGEPFQSHIGSFREKYELCAGVAFGCLFLAQVRSQEKTLVRVAFCVGSFLALVGLGLWFWFEKLGIVITYADWAPV